MNDIFGIRGALTGLIVLRNREPRAMPWADMVCPYGAWRDRFGEPMLFIFLVQP